MSSGKLTQRLSSLLTPVDPLRDVECNVRPLSSFRFLWSHPTLDCRSLEDAVVPGSAPMLLVDSRGQ